MSTTYDAVLSAVRALPHTRVKETAAHAFRCNSPLRAGANSFSFAVTATPDGEHGAFIDHVTNEKGSLYQLRDALGVAPLVNSTNVPRPRRPQRLEAYANEHGAPLDAFLLAGWTETQHARVPALRIETENGARFRMLEGTPKYRSERGHRQCWYKLADAVNLSKERGIPLVLVNGEASVVACQYHGVAAVCVTSGSEKAIPAHLVPALKAAYTGAEIIVALDCDAKGRAGAVQLAQQLRGVGYAPRVVNLGLEDKQDAADFVRIHGAADLYALPDVADSVTAAREASILSAMKTPAQIHDAIASGAIKPARNIVYQRNGSGPLLWVGAHILAARPKTYKSMLALHIADVVSDASTDLFKAQRFETAHGSVLYLDFEMQTTTANRRMADMGIPIIEGREALRYLSSSEWKKLLRAEAHADETALAQDAIRIWCKNEKRHGRTPALVVVDTVSAIVNATYAANTDTHTADYRYYAAWNDLAAETDTAILLLAHLTKGTKNTGDPADAVYGSGKIQGAVENILTLTRKDDDDTFVTLKSRTREAPFPATVLQYDTQHRHHVIPNTVPVQAFDISKTKAQTLEAIRNGARTAADIVDITGKSLTVIRNALGALVNEGYAQRTARGEYEATDRA